MPSKKIHETREAWLVAAGEMLREHVDAVDPKRWKMPKHWRTSVMPPRRPKPGVKVLGQAHSCQDGKWWHTFISSEMVDRVQIIGVLAHEIAHITVGIEEGHRQGTFGKMVRSLGLAGKLTATFVEEKSDFEKLAKRIAAKCGAYPHAALEGADVYKERKPNPHQWVHYQSPLHPHIKAQIPPKLVEQGLIPLCPVTKKTMVPRVKGT